MSLYLDESLETDLLSSSILQSETTQNRIENLLTNAINRYGHDLRPVKSGTPFSIIEDLVIIRNTFPNNRMRKMKHRKGRTSDAIKGRRNRVLKKVNEGYLKFLETHLDSDNFNSNSFNIRDFIIQAIPRSSIVNSGLYQSEGTGVEVLNQTAIVADNNDDSAFSFDSAKRRNRSKSSRLQTVTRQTQPVYTFDAARRDAMPTIKLNNSTIWEPPNRRFNQDSSDTEPVVQFANETKRTQRLRVAFAAPLPPANQTLVRPEEPPMQQKSPPPPQPKSEDEDRQKLIVGILHILLKNNHRLYSTAKDSSFTNLYEDMLILGYSLKSLHDIRLPRTRQNSLQAIRRLEDLNSLSRSDLKTILQYLQKNPSISPCQIFLRVNSQNLCSVIQSKDAKLQEWVQINLASDKIQVPVARVIYEIKAPVLDFKQYPTHLKQALQISRSTGIKLKVLLKNPELLTRARNQAYKVTSEPISFSSY